MKALADRRCIDLVEGTPPLGPIETGALLTELDGWQVEDGRRLVRTWRFDDFAGALALVNRVGAVAEAENHHPDIELGWGRVVVRLWTHTVGGLSDNDFIVAAKIDRVVAEAQARR